jgi:phage-related protein
MDILHTEQPSFQEEPSFGASVSFSSLRDMVKYGDNHSTLSPKGINALTMRASLSFDVLTDSEAQSIVSFLQSRFYNEAQAYDSAGKFSNKRITPFSYQLFYPYKVNKFYCNEFTHKKLHNNVNQITASFECAHPTILDSVETYLGFNNDGEYSNIDTFIENNAIINKSPGAQSINFTNHAHAFNLQSNVNIFPSGSYQNIEIASDTTTSPISVIANNAVMSNSKFVVPNTAFRNSIFINNPNECSYYPYPPTIEGGFMKHRMFDFIPSQSLSIKHDPKFLQSNASEIYFKYSKYGFNPNLVNLSLTFGQRTDLEAKRILLFLESHLGHKKFGFHLPEPYRARIEDTLNKTPHRRAVPHFYCPEWSHTVTYKNNHAISATFIECLDY